MVSEVVMVAGKLIWVIKAFLLHMQEQENRIVESVFDADLLCVHMCVAFMCACVSICVSTCVPILHESCTLEAAAPLIWVPNSEPVLTLVPISRFEAYLGAE